MPRAVVLFSGGLDSTLAVRILQQQGFEVEALNIRTIFECCKARAAKAAADLDVRLTVLSVADDYLDVIRNPVHGYGKGVNACIDCRIHMCKMAKTFMEQVGACVVVTGEVLGQRPMSQRRWQVELIERKSGLEGRLLRPLSAKLLPPTVPERDGLIDRDRLYGFNGSSRKALIALGRQLGLRDIPQPSTGCALTEVTFAPRVRDLIKSHPTATRWDFELLNVGRHVRFDAKTKAVAGRNERENSLLRGFFQRADAPEPALLQPENFRGPYVIVVGNVRREAIELAAGFLLRFARRRDPKEAQVRLTYRGSSQVVEIRGAEMTAPVPLL